MNYWIWFSTIKGLGPIQKKILLEKIGTPDKIYKTNISDIEKINGIKKEAIINIEKSKNKELLKRYEEYIYNHEIEVIAISDVNYPAALREIYDPPITLFAKGNLTLLGEKSIGVVGSRDATQYGFNTAKELSYSLSQNNIVIVSGLAKGIDKAAHIGALNANGNTIAVLGCGIDICYPKENVVIYKEILKKGLIISEYIVGTKPEAGNFPARNRIISGLSNGVVIVEAKSKSGAIITADFALEQGRTVYAVPGNINSVQSGGTNELIKQGAKVITSVNDILEDL